MAPPVWARRTDTGWVLSIRAQPGARRTEVAGPYREALKIRLAAPADDNKANTELVRFLAATLMVARRDVQLVRGRASRDKVVRIADETADPTRLL
ncbi:MAG: DUF167 domain-containing protein [Acidimicrobiales bacterium]